MSNVTDYSDVSKPSSAGNTAKGKETYNFPSGQNKRRESSSVTKTLQSEATNNPAKSQAEVTTVSGKGPH